MNLGEPSFFPTIEAHAQAPIVGGNRLTLLLNGEQIYPAILGRDPESQDDDHVRPVQLRGRADRPRPRRGAGRALPRRSPGARPARQRRDPLDAPGVHGAHDQGRLRGGLVPADRALRPPARQQPEPPAHPRRRRARRLHRRLRRQQQVDGQRSDRGPLAGHRRPDRRAGGRVPPGRVCRELGRGHRDGPGRRGLLPGPDAGQGAGPTPRSSAAAPWAAATPCTRPSSSPCPRPGARSRSPTRTCCSTSR